jgi:hypothetical protein
MRVSCGCCCCCAAETLWRVSMLPLSGLQQSNTTVNPPRQCLKRWTGSHGWAPRHEGIQSASASDLVSATSRAPVPTALVLDRLIHWHDCVVLNTRSKCLIVSPFCACSLVVALTRDCNLHDTIQILLVGNCRGQLHV